MSFLINPYRFVTAGGGGDPYFSSVTLLLHGDGADGATSTIDSSNAAHVITAAGDAQLDTAVKKWGTASMLFDGNDYFSAANSTDFQFGSGDFTIECWCYVTNSAARTIISRWQGANLSWYLGAGGAGYGFYFSTNGINANIALPLSSWPSTNTWFHIAVARSGANLRLFVDGIQQGATYNIGSTSIHAGSSQVTIGDDANSNPGFYGNIDDIRITKGVARYTSDFTPPTAAFPDS